MRGGGTQSLSVASAAGSGIGLMCGTEYGLSDEARRAAPAVIECCGKAREA